MRQKQGNPWRDLIRKGEENATEKKYGKGGEDAELEEGART